MSGLNGKSFLKMVSITSKNSVKQTKLKEQKNA